MSGRVLPLLRVDATASARPGAGGTPNPELNEAAEANGRTHRERVRQRAGTEPRERSTRPAGSREGTVGSGLYAARGAAALLAAVRRARARDAPAGWCIAPPRPPPGHPNTGGTRTCAALQDRRPVVRLPIREEQRSELRPALAGFRSAVAPTRGDGASILAAFAAPSYAVGTDSRRAPTRPGMHRTLVVVFGSVLVAAIAWFALAPRSGDAAPQEGTTRPEAPEQLGSPDARGVEAGERATVRSKAPPAGEAVLRGRCVDEDGAPLAGVTVHLHGWEADRERADAYRRDHGEVEWEDPANTTTGPDGRFDVRFAPPPPFTFALHLEHPDRAPVSGRWSPIAPGSVEDLGDVVVPLGVRVAGCVVDTEGVPRENVWIELARIVRPDRPRVEVRAPRSVTARTSANGTFRFKEPVAAGTWSPRIRGARLVEPRDRVELVMPSTELDFVVQPAVERLTVRGVVVDESGVPVAGADVGAPGTGGGTSSARDGTFTLTNRTADPDEPFHLRVEREGYDFLTTEAPVRWGAEDVRLVLRRGLDVHVYVRRAEDGTPVEEFGVRVFPDPSTSSRWNSRWIRIRGGWQHEGGHAVVEGIRRGAHWVVVEPREASGLDRPRPSTVVVRDGPPVVVDVALPNRASQEVRVVRSDGSAVAGSKVELLDRLDGEAVEPGTRALTYEKWSYSSRGKAVLIDEARTDFNGVCTLEGPGDRPFTIRVTGDEHAPMVRDDVRLEDGRTEVVVPAGATLRVTLRPIELLGDLREQALLPRTGPVEARSRDRMPTVRLVRGDGRARKEFPAQTGGIAPPFDDDGEVVLRGIPPGTWDVQLETTWAHSPDTSIRYTSGGDTVRTGVELRDGEETSILLNLPDVRAGRLRGRLIVAGEPYEGPVDLAGVVGALPDGSPWNANRETRTDADGRFEALLPSGTWRAGAWVSLSDSAVVMIQAFAPSPAVVVPGEETVADFDVRLGRATIRLLRPDGRPAEGVQLSFQRGGEMLSVHAPETDADGRTTVTATPGDGLPLVNVRSMTDPARLREYWKQHRDDAEAMEQITITLPPVTFLGGEPREVELRLPPDWDR